jgi:hypothetical protein
MVGFIRAFSFELQKGTESYQGLFVCLERVHHVEKTPVKRL